MTRDEFIEFLKKEFKPDEKMRFLMHDDEIGYLVVTGVKAEIHEEDIVEKSHFEVEHPDGSRTSHTGSEIKNMKLDRTPYFVVDKSRRETYKVISFL